MNRSKLASRAERTALKRRYARINWNAHLVPLVQEAVAAFAKDPCAKGEWPQVALLSDIPHLEHADLEARPGDAITIQFGAHPGYAAAPAAPGYSRPFLAEDRTGLVFCQDASGGVAVFVYPPAAARPAQRHYLVARYRNPAQLTRSRLLRLLHELFEMDHCFSRHPASVASGRRLLLLEARSAALEAGSADLMAQVRHLTHLARGLVNLYRLAQATPKARPQPVWLAAYAAHRVPRPPRFGRTHGPLRATPN